MKKILALTLLPTTVAFAQAKHQTKEYIVEEGVGTFDVNTSPDLVTVIYLPDQAKRAIASDSKNFSIGAIGDTITVRPTGNVTGAANLEVETASLKLSIILHVGKADDAMSQVVFRKAEDKAAFDQRVADEVAKQTAALKAEVEQKEAALGGEIAQRAEKEIANRMLKRFEARSLDGIARTTDNVIIRVDRAIVIGDEAFLGFDIQNRGTAPYRLKSIGVHQGPTAVDAHASLEAAASGDEGSTFVGVIGGGSHADGVVVIDTTKLAKGPVAVRFVDEHDGALDLGGLKAP